MIRNKRYNIDQSPLYKLSNHAKLAKLFNLKTQDLIKIKKTEYTYVHFNIQKKDGGFRTIDQPPEKIKKIQKKIATLLQRISLPEYVMSPVKGRSYVDNAAKHVGSKAFCQLDIVDFFPSCKSEKIFCFFRKKMKCSIDIADTLTKITTYKGVLPQGSPSSPILSFLSNIDMWEDINEITSKEKLKFSLYVDDITISGEFIPKKCIWGIKKIIHGNGLKYSKEKERFTISKPRIVTGVVVNGENIYLPNKQHKKLYEVESKHKISIDSKEKLKLKNEIAGRKAQAKQIQNHFSRSQ